MMTRQEYSSLLRELTAKHRQERLALRWRYDEERLALMKRGEKEKAERRRPPPLIDGSSIREICMRNRGHLSASRIAAQIGISRNAVIGHWFRGCREASR
jgi:hypothetical protein